MKTQEENIDFTKINSSEKEAIRQICLNKFKPNNSFYIFTLKIFNIFGYKDNLKSVSKFTFEIINYLKVHAPNNPYIFIIKPNYNIINRLVTHIKLNERIDLTQYSVYDIVTALRIYINDELDGLIPRSVALTLKKSYKTDDFKECIKYLPFTMKDDRRKLLLELIDLFDKIDKKSNINFMNLNNIYLIFLPDLLPKVVVDYQSEDFYYFIKRMRILFYADFEKIKINHKERKDYDFYYECKLC